MKLKNTTDFPDWFLRRLVAWCCRQSELPARRVRLATFRNCKGIYSGHASGSTRIVVRIGRTGYPMQPDLRAGMSGEVMADRTEALVMVTAHEVEHLCQYAERRQRTLAASRRTEPVTRAHGIYCLRLFREQRAALVTEWMEPPVPRVIKARPSVAERNEINARSNLAKWEKKQRAATNRVKHWRAKVRRYERRAATSAK